MHREDESNYLLYIEPNINEKSVEPVEDKLSKLMEKAFKNAKEGVSNYYNLENESKFQIDCSWRGRHRTACGVWSTNKDYLLENGMIVNSLCVYYLKYYRKSIPETDKIKLKKLFDFYITKK